MIDLRQETPISLADVPKCIPPGRSGRPTHISTVVRWISKGVQGVKLEAIRLGGRWVTSREALQRFAERLTNVRAGNPIPTSVRTSSRRQAAAVLAERELEKLGI